jgi:hypothetical protein
MTYSISFERHGTFLLAHVTGDGDPESVRGYYAEACRVCADAGFRRLLVESHVINKRWTYEEAKEIAEFVADAANSSGVHAVAVVAHDPGSNRDAEQFAVRVFERKAVSGRYFHDDLDAATEWITSA